MRVLVRPGKPKVPKPRQYRVTPEQLVEAVETVLNLARLLDITIEDAMHLYIEVKRKAEDARGEVKTVVPKAEVEDDEEAV